VISFKKSLFGLIVGFLFILFVIFYLNPSLDESWEDFSVYLFKDYKSDLKALEQLYQIEIDYTVDNNYLVESWKDQPARGHATQISDIELAHFSTLLPRLLKKYPPQVIRSSLSKIKLSGSLNLFNTAYGGTTYGTTLYLTSSGASNGFTDEYLEELFHHEFSSILMRKYGFPEKEWTMINPTGFQYAQSVDKIIQAVSKGDDNRENKALYKIGFLNEYAMSTLENDVNTFAETVFSNPKKIYTIAITHPRIAKKLAILEQFYLNIDAGFNEVFQAIN
jgi:hypothetical protein